MTNQRKQNILKKLAAAKPLISLVDKGRRAKKLKSLGFKSEEEYAKFLARHGEGGVPALSKARRPKAATRDPRSIKGRTREDIIEASIRERSKPFYIPKGTVSPTSEASMARDAAKRRLAGIE